MIHDTMLSPEQLEERRPEIENRIRNLFWTVSGDYTQDIRPDVETFAVSPTLALYQAIKQGAFAHCFDARELALYTLKKQARGADAQALTELTQLCVDAAVYPRVSAERSGVRAIREAAFRELLAEDAETPAARLRQCLVRQFLELPVMGSPDILIAARKVEALGRAAGTDAVIRTIDALYNSLVEPGFEARGGDLNTVLAVTPEELAEEYHRELTDAQLQAVMEEYLSILKDELLRMKTLAPAPRRAPPTPVISEEEDAELPEPSPEELAKVRAYVERQFGKSYLTELEQARLNRKLCTGMHRHCILYFTDGILSNPAIKNTQYLRSQMQSEKNQLYYNIKRRQIGRSIQALGTMLKQVLILQADEDIVRAEYGQISPTRLWMPGRTEQPKLFDLKRKREAAHYVVDLLLDASSSQSMRQPQIAAQAYIISAALSMARIPHRVSCFCSYWDYTILHRFRDYDDPAERDRNVLQYRAFGENRDSLAIRSVCHTLDERTEPGKLLIMLSDGRPNHLGSLQKGTRSPAPYVGEEAIRDTALEIRKARNRGLRVLGVFVGDEADLAAEKRIFGKDFTYTRSISSFAHIVGSYLRRLLEQGD